MKKLIFSLAVAAAAVITTAQAGDGKTCDKDKAACADKAKTSVSAKSTCAEKAACCAKEKVAKKVVNPDEKGATFLVKR